MLSSLVSVIAGCRAVDGPHSPQLLWMFLSSQGTALGTLTMTYLASHHFLLSLSFFILLSWSVLTTSQLPLWIVLCQTEICSRIALRANGPPSPSRLALPDWNLKGLPFFAWMVTIALWNSLILPCQIKDAFLYN